MKYPQSVTGFKFQTHKTLKSILVAAMAAGFVVSTGGHAATATGTATATVITPITITNTADLAFGQFAAGTGGTVVMSPASARTATGGVVLSTVNPGAAASFSIGGAANATYAITLPADGVVTISDGAATPTTMAANTFTSSPSATGTLDAGGAQIVTVGATLTVANAQLTAAYTGTFNVTVEYN